ncbi:MAG: PilZ domain-containing protein [Turneriella sp.]
MSILRQSLALQIIPADENPEGKKYQGILETLEDRYIQVRMDPSYREAPPSELLRVEFTMANFRFHFDSAIEPNGAGDIISIVKPTKIYKSTIRKSPRLRLDLGIGYNLWTEPGRYEATLTDLSAVGMKMFTDRMLPKNTLINMNVYLPGKSLRFICQGIVRWCTRSLETETKYGCGVLFTTLSNDATKRVEKFIKEELEKTEPL